MNETLKIIISKLSGLKFAVIGTANMAIQGIDVSPNDLDFATTDLEIEKIAKILNSEIFNNNGYKEIEMEIKNTPVHFVSVTTNPLREDNLEAKIYIEKWGMKIPCMSLQSELEFYRKLDSAKARGKVKLLEEKIKK